MLSAILYIYLFAVINSLWKKFKDEQANGHRPQTANLALFNAAEVQPKV
jgi:hypothetical protein